MFRWIVLVSCLMGVIVGLIIGVMNPQPVDVFLPGVQFTLGLGGVMMLAFAAGVTVGLLLFLLLFHLPWRVNRHGKVMASKGTGLSDRNA